MSREHRPSVVVCACCGEKSNAREAREFVVSWPLTNSGKGTMQSAEAPMRTNVYVCKACWKQRLAMHLDKMPHEIHVLVARAGVVGRDLLHFLIPQPTEMFPTERSSTA